MCELQIFESHKIRAQGECQHMKCLLITVAVFGLAGLGSTMSLQQRQSSSPDALPQPQQTDTANPQPSARSFEGTIAKMGDEYKLDDQQKAKHFEGKNVKIMATVDANTNTLHVVDIIPVTTE
ncbi:MAG: hypothetical protein DMG79_15730 [Acidobacteria bacterium]|nr:MAG: hypothetical protein DMG79_15730 [Acidobacteriota bacterium]